MMESRQSTSSLRGFFQVKRKLSQCFDSISIDPSTKRTHPTPPPAAHANPDPPPPPPVAADDDDRAVIGPSPSEVAQSVRVGAKDSRSEEERSIGSNIAHMIRTHEDEIERLRAAQQAQLKRLLEAHAKRTLAPPKDSEPRSPSEQLPLDLAEPVFEEEADGAPPPPPLSPLPDLDGLGSEGALLLPPSPTGGPQPSASPLREEMRRIEEGGSSPSASLPPPRMADMPPPPTVQPDGNPVRRTPRNTGGGTLWHAAWWKV